ncbi:MAG: hypothetical protein KIT72_08395 [Polyangiaceae bacterium]|nr:hypothetical protein [Polyangiaceae bacterium]MCW5790427.1 hypothetical protein [Polyangiaceae bacterium]
MSRLLRNRLTAACCLAVMLTACGGSGGAQGDAEAPRRRGGAGADEGETAPRGLPSHVFAQVPEGTYGPYMGSSARGAIALWAAPGAGKVSWHTRAFDERGAPRGDGHQFDGAPSELGLAVVKPAGRGGVFKTSGYAALFTERTATGERVGAIALNEDGALLAGPFTVTQSDAAVLWLSGAPTARGAIAVWAARGNGQASLYAAELGDGTSPARPTPFTQRARAWQAVPFAGGVAVAWVEAPTASASAPERVSGPVMLALIDERGALKGKAVTLADTAGAELDLDLVVTNAGLVAAWSDRSDLEARVHLALADASGKVLIAPKAALPTAGEQALVDLLAPPGGLGPAYVVWETPGRAEEGARWLDVARLDARLEPEKRARLRVAGPADTIPELVASQSGVAALTLAESCPKAGPCDDPDLLPTFVQFSAQLDLVASEPLRTREYPHGINLAWGLTCPSAACFAVAAGSDNPAPLFSVALKKTELEHRPAGEAWALESPPNLLASRPVASTDPLSDVAALPTQGGHLVSWITYFDDTTPYTRRTTPAPDGRFDPVRAVLSVRALKTDGAASDPSVISYRARALGGIALSPGDASKGHLLVWTAVDAGRPQVFTTLVSSEGKKLSQQMLTRTPGDVSDVAATRIDEAPGRTAGWLVGWVDERSGDPEVYVARLSSGLQRVGGDTRLTQAAGAATDVSLLAQGEQVWAAWSDAREATAPGVADIYVARTSHTGQPSGGERLVVSTPGHSHSPQLALAGDAVTLTWIEEGEGAGLRFTQLGADGAPTSSPLTIPLPDAALPTAVSVVCSPGLCRGVASASRGAASELYGFVVRPPAALVKLQRLSRLDGPSAQSVAPALLGDLLWFADQREGRGFLREARIRWP